MLNSSVGAIGEWLNVGGDGFPKKLCTLWPRLLLWVNCPCFLCSAADSHRALQEQLFVVD